jgi:hypothetical protein
LEVARVTLHELVGLPKAIFYEHLRERRKVKMTGKFSSRFDFAPGTRSEIWAALAPFLLFGALTTLLAWMKVFDLMPLWFSILFVVALWGIGLSLFVIGFKKGHRAGSCHIWDCRCRSSVLLAFNTLVNPEWRGFPFLYESSWFVKQFSHQGVLWAGLFLSIFLIFLLTRFIPRLRSFHQRLQTDFTLLCFILYGAIPLVIVFSFEEFKNEEPYLLCRFWRWHWVAGFTCGVQLYGEKFWSLIWRVDICHVHRSDGTNFPL